MPHTTNRTAFLSAKKGTTPLVSAYVQLIAIEIALKDNEPTWPRDWSHDVVKMLGTFKDAGLVAFGQQLRQQLSAVKCTCIKGNQVTVRPEKYPDLRYTRHRNDFPGGTTDADLLALNATIDNIVIQLRNKKVPL